MSYDPVLGRWATADPERYVDGLNIYAYLRSNPAAFRDPVGLAAEDEPRQANTWIISGTYDLVLLCDPAFRTVPELRQAWQRYEGRVRNSTSVATAYTAAEVKDKIIARSKELARARNARDEEKVPIRGLLIAHGTSAGGDVRVGGAHEPLWDSQPDPFADNQGAAALRGSPLLDAKGHILDMTFAACGVANGSEKFLDSIRQELGVRQLTAPRRMGHVYPQGRVVGMNLTGEGVTQKNIGDFIYTAGGGDAEKER